MLLIIISRDVSNYNFQKCQQLYIFRNAGNCYYLSVVVRPLSVRLSRRRHPSSVRPPVVCLNITCKTSRSINYDQIDKQIHRSLEERGPKLEMLSKRLEKNERSYCYSPKLTTTQRVALSVYISICTYTYIYIYYHSVRRDF